MCLELDPKRSLRKLLGRGRCLRVLEVHSPLSALLAARVSYEFENGRRIAYDAVWSSSFCDSILRALPDIEILTPHDRLTWVRDILAACSCPLVFDGDTGGRPEHFSIYVRLLEMAGVSAVVIEDKRGLKVNSLFAKGPEQKQASVEMFCEKIRAGCDSRVSGEFMVIARCESLILGKGVDDAIARCVAYAAAGADGVMIHSRSETGDEIFDFARRFHDARIGVSLICAPTTYAHVPFEAFEGAGFSMVIYANQMLRSSFRAMKEGALDILRYGRTLEIEGRCASVDEVLHAAPHDVGRMLDIKDVAASTTSGPARDVDGTSSCRTSTPEPSRIDPDDPPSR